METIKTSELLNVLKKPRKERNVESAEDFVFKPKEILSSARLITGIGRIFLTVSVICLILGGLSLTVSDATIGDIAKLLVYSGLAGLFPSCVLIALGRAILCLIAIEQNTRQRESQ